jgi:hypothetical protein
VLTFLRVFELAIASVIKRRGKFFRKTEGYFTLRKKRKNFFLKNFCKKIAKTKNKRKFLRKIAKKNKFLQEKKLKKKKNPYGSVQKNFRNEHFLRKKRSLRTLFITLAIAHILFLRFKMSCSVSLGRLDYSLINCLKELRYKA